MHLCPMMNFYLRSWNVSIVNIIIDSSVLKHPINQNEIFQKQLNSLKISNYFQGSSINLLRLLSRLEYLYI